MSTSQKIDTHWKEEFKKLLAHTILDAYEHKKISYADMQHAADFVLRSNIQDMNTREEVMKKVEEMQKEWPIFDKVLDQEQVKKKEESEQEIINRLTDYIKNYPESQK